MAAEEGWHPQIQNGVGFSMRSAKQPCFFQSHFRSADTFVWSPTTQYVKWAFLLFTGFAQPILPAYEKNLCHRIRMPMIRSISPLRLPLLRLLDSNLLGSSLWAWDSHPLRLRLCLSKILWNPERRLAVSVRSCLFEPMLGHWCWYDGRGMHSCALLTRVSHSEGGMIRLESLIELNFLDSSSSSLSSHWNQTGGSLSSDSRQQHLSQRYSPLPSYSCPFATRRPGQGPSPYSGWGGAQCRRWVDSERDVWCIVYF